MSLSSLPRIHLVNSLEGLTREKEGKIELHDKLMVCNWQINYR